MNDNRDGWLNAEASWERERNKWRERALRAEATLAAHGATVPAQATGRGEGGALKACPFCGDDKPMIHTWTAAASVYCPTCLVSTTRNGYPSLGQAMNTWNRRASQPAASGPMRWLPGDEETSRIADKMIADAQAKLGPPRPIRRDESVGGEGAEVELADRMLAAIGMQGLLSFPINRDQIETMARAALSRGKGEA